MIELFIRGRKLNISFTYLRKIIFCCAKNIRQTSMHCFVMKIPNKRELQKVAFNQSSDFMSL